MFCSISIQYSNYDMAPLSAQLPSEAYLPRARSRTIDDVTILHAYVLYISRQSCSI